MDGVSRWESKGERSNGAACLALPSCPLLLEEGYENVTLRGLDESLGSSSGWSRAPSVMSSRDGERSGRLNPSKVALTFALESHADTRPSEDAVPVVPSASPASSASPATIWELS